MSDPVELSVVVPAYNEAGRLKNSLPSFQAFLNQCSLNWELVLVDDGSADATAQAFDGHFPEGKVQVVRYAQNMGKGYAVRQGVARARGDLVLLTDADLSAPLEDFERLHAAIRKGHDVAVGSRALQDSDVVRHQAWYREGMGKIFNLFVQLLVIRGIWDTQCGFKCFKRELAAPVFQVMRINRFCFDVEFLYLCKKRNLRIAEVSIHWANVKESRVHLLYDSAKMFGDLLRIRYNDLCGRYRS
jgi:dolichyl-phosphate beta-glucosyltransferase